MAINCGIHNFIEGELDRYALSSFEIDKDEHLPEVSKLDDLLRRCVTL